MGTQTMGVLDELEARAGASDQDREQWLAERRRGVTATELRDIMLASNRDVVRVRDEMRGRVGRPKAKGRLSDGE